MSAEHDSPYDVVLIWAYNFASLTIESLDPKFPELGIGRNSEVFGGIYQSAVIVAALLHIERSLGKRDYSQLHSRIIENIDSTVRSRYLAPIQDLCSFLLQRPLQVSEFERIPSLEPLQDRASEDLESSIGFWMARSLIGTEPKLDHELQFASKVGELVYSDNARFVASLFLSDGKRIDLV